MDLLQEIRERIMALPERDRLGCLDVLRHLDHCDRLLRDGRQGTPEFFNDIIYRANQAFEGALKEAYRILEGKDPDAVSLYKVENTFVKNSLVRPKVLGLMKNYRTEWRNPSTHDYTLKFDESEAILAIASVSAFFIGLLSQIKDKLAIRPAEEAARGALADSVRPGVSLHTAVGQVIQQALPALSHLNKLNQTGRQIELFFAEALTLANPTWKVEREPSVQLTSGVRVTTDILVTQGSDKVVVEIKRFVGANPSQDDTLRAIDQMRRFMQAVDVRSGVLVTLPQRDVDFRQSPSISEKVYATSGTEWSGAITEIRYSADKKAP